MSAQPQTPEEQAAHLAKLRKEAYAALEDHQHDMATDPIYRATVQKEEQRAEAKARKAGRTKFA